MALPEKTWLLVVGDNHGAANDVELLYAEIMRATDLTLR